MNDICMWREGGREKKGERESDCVMGLSWIPRNMKHTRMIYIRVLNSAHNGFSSWVTMKYETLVIVASSPRLAVYDKTYTTRVSYFAVSHSDP